MGSYFENESVDQLTVVKVFTSKSVRRILDDGGVGDWRVSSDRLHGCKYVICCRNSRPKSAPEDVDHGAAFLIGVISGLIPVGDNRIRIQLSEYAECKVAGVWKSESQNPVRYLSQSLAQRQLMQSFEDFKFVPFPEVDISKIESVVDSTKLAAKTGLTIPEAKKGLAETLGVDPSQIEITIRG